MRRWRKERYNEELRFWFIHKHYYLKNTLMVCNTRVSVSRVMPEPFVSTQYEVTIFDNKTNDVIGYGVDFEFEDALREAYKREECEYHNL